MRFLEYMDFVLAVFPLKYGFIIVQVVLLLTSLEYALHVFPIDPQWQSSLKMIIERLSALFEQHNAQTL